MKTCCIITPTTGNSLLLNCIESVQRQKLESCVLTHLIVVDGVERKQQALRFATESDRLKILILPYATGRRGFNGHRIYAGLPYLIDSDYITFLDEDNTLDENHIESLVRLVTDQCLDWAYSLRKLMLPNGCVFGNDNCQSLGTTEAWDGNYFLVDLNCYLFRKSVATSISYILNRSDEDCPPMERVDRALTRHLFAQFPRFSCSALYTANYRIASRTDLRKTLRYFLLGNAVMHEKAPYFRSRDSVIRGTMSHHPHFIMEWRDFDYTSAKQKIEKQIETILGPDFLRVLEKPAADARQNKI